jgi:F0F1-type ATP synthase assembly protein I
MAGEAAKLKSSITAAPLGAAGGAVIGYLTAKFLGYEKNISVVSFTMVGLIIGAAVGAAVGKKITN